MRPWAFTEAFSEPIPEKPNGRPRDHRADQALLNLKVGECLDVDRNVRAVLIRIRRLHGRYPDVGRYTVRKIKLEVTRVWRIE
jgi:hypothetical protein